QGHRLEWTVTGMDCAACTVKVTRAVERLPGVSDVKVALMGERLSLDLAPGTTPAAEVEGVVRRLGYGIAPRAPGVAAPAAAGGCCGAGAHDHGADAGHGAPGHVHDDPADRGKAW